MSFLLRILPKRPLGSSIRLLSLCPTCSRPLPTNLPACTACSSIHPLPSHLSHHHLFGLDEGSNPFLVDLPTLKKRFRDAQAACHPDTWASKSPRDQDLAHSLSSRLNEAYQCLLHPLPRAEYILEKNGLQTNETDQVEDMGFMANIMDAREVIDDATPEHRADVEALIESNQENITRTIGELTSLIERRDWPSVKSATIRLRYLQGIDRAAKQWIDNN
ncbi:hypothetical protein M413DRAFT_439917 [Hebeloma cylindrosporum]|uniref:Co-chaperone HscB C-terminal oligomerisation domain-containing protein n=1 Tax=Hebeloma cylindrosporum TaxID=76867 RepID=A0A0C2YEK2_HEBCY|nr:hypothetical protein M413DRAFT_439917 [Hebeloma cylindrosporum h7]